ncbi:diguanylate cyclase [Oryzomonas japonica]|uniref:diguanylate cyclase n=1 Tax=Oryzomonas japonica TaxID=2603858 RepID=A0A7J4ZTI4_9BACT|nr:diguanylate cyclase [Oryzomonas japonica]KAB0666780.1 diguanylate cyclase [Oryzomonas japonica]
MEKILVIEDDRFFRETFSDLLQKEGYDVDCAGGGGEGLEMLAGKRYDLVITDLIMPEVDGMEVLSRVKGSNPDIDVIMVTGNTDLESAIFALKHGARDYLLKPVNPDEFRHSVALCIQQRRLLNENEELKKMVSLFQVSQTIASCLELERIYHLMVEAVAREVGVGRYLGFFQADSQLELKEVRGLTSDSAEHYRKIVQAALPEKLPTSHQIDMLALPGEADNEIEEACLIYVCNRGMLHGVIVLFNEPGHRLPDIQRERKNILFLLEQSSQAFENAETYSRAKDMLFIDDLSGLFNHRYLEVALNQELKRVERYSSHLAVLFLDIDSFKSVNDTYGHLVGSQVLREMGALAQKAVREVDVVIRYGGDEFTIILVETGCDIALMVAERIRKRIESHVFLAPEGYNIRLTCSIGYACCPDDTLSKYELLEMADKAMYSSKSSGKNCVSHFSFTS